MSRIDQRHGFSAKSAFLLAFLLAATIFARSAPTAANVQVSLSCPHEARQVLTLGSAAGERADILVSITATSWLEIEEKGLEVDLASNEHPTELRIAGPPRFGWRFLQIESPQQVVLTRTRRGDRNASVLLTLHCEVSVNLRRRLDWFREATGISVRVREQVPVADLESSLAGIDALRTAAPDAKTDASALHLRAQALLFAGRSVDATAAFAIAEAAWTSLGDRDRARVARVARIEDSIRAGQYAAAIDLARSFPGAPSSASYFGVRMERSRCLALTYLGRTAEAEECYPQVISQLEALDEYGEVANTLQAYAGVEVDAANYPKAEQLARRALGLAAGVDASLYRGRIHLMLADIALRRGLVSEALRNCDVALAEFDQVHATRWEANTMLKVVQLHEQLGDYDEAFSFLAGALSRLSARDAPSRWAKGMELFSDLERDHGHFESAYIWERAAEKLYSQLEMAGDAEGALLSRLGILLRMGDQQSVLQALTNREATQPLHATGFALLEADLSLQRGQLEDTRQALEELRMRPMSLETQIRFARIEGEYKQAAGDVHGALAGLLEEGRRIERLAERTQSGILRQVIARQASPLRQTAFRLALQQLGAAHNSVDGSDAVWSWLTLNAPASALRSEVARTGKSLEQFENAVAAELFLSTSAGRAAAESTAQRELLSMLASGGGRNLEADAPLRTFKLESLQQVLSPDAAFVAFLDGDTRGAVLWVTRQQADFLTSSRPSDLRANIMELRDLVRTPDSPLTEIQVVAQRLSTELFAGMRATPPPKHLYVLAEEPFNAVPWSVLTWPGAGAFVLDTTTVEYVRLFAGENDDKSSLPTNLQVVVAAQQGDYPALPVLAGAATEAAAIGQAVATTATLIEIPAATRAAVTSVLRETGAWVHIAAHGMAQPQRIGYAGIWLEPSGEEKTPPFLSWIDILDSGVNADLVVLNACQAGDNGSAINGNLSFADAVSSAGAKHVVAALWPVSDAAAALWVPEFYSTIVADPRHDAAEALRAAQLRLRESRAFRHPFFWAGMQVIDRMPIGSKVAH